MERETQGILLFFLAMIYTIVWAIFYKILPGDYNFVILIFWIIIFILFVNWIHRNSNLFSHKSKRKKTRLTKFEKSSVFKIIIPLGYISGGLLILVGIFSVIFGGLDELYRFFISTLIGIIVILIIFFLSKLLKKFK